MYCIKHLSLWVQDYLLTQFSALQSRGIQKSFEKLKFGDKIVTIWEQIFKSIEKLIPKFGISEKCSSFQKIVNYKTFFNV